MLLVNKTSITCPEPKVVLLCKPREVPHSYMTLLVRCDLVRHRREKWIVHRYKDYYCDERTDNLDI
ncbi:unnamed protein product [Leptidea sinapis]|uniref:Uncharacterized protein n=1 Tax=Leptidea sinapis TaxID=189913 RepID=A0A5E4QJ69_9NEOP|nr:unnamed protein product [Leptidea sinapis]